jgi:Flp pilus assembly protein TadB
MPVATSQQPARSGRQPARSSEPVLITEAEPSLDDQHAARKKRYAITMGVRAVAITLAAVVYQYALWLAIVFAVLGTVLPWIAVVMANDRPPKHKLFQAYDARPDRVLEARPARVIDAD